MLKAGMMESIELNVYNIYIIFFYINCLYSSLPISMKIDENIEINEKGSKIGHKHYLISYINT